MMNLKDEVEQPNMFDNVRDPIYPEPDEVDGSEQTPICPFTGSYCTGDHCEYGCAKDAGFFDDDEPNF